MSSPRQQLRQLTATLAALEGGQDHDLVQACGWDLRRLSDAELEWLAGRFRDDDDGTTPRPLTPDEQAEWDRLERICTGGPAL